MERRPILLLLLTLTLFSSIAQSREYRSVDGTGNNVANPLAGGPGQPYLRTAVPGTSYADANQTMLPSPSGEFMVKCTDPLPAGDYPLSRCVSNVASSYRTVSTDFNARSGFKSFRKVSHMITFFGQWLSFDLTSSSATQEPYKIVIPEDDAIYSSEASPSFDPNVSFPFRRADYASSPTAPAARSGINAATSFLDASPLYSSNIVKLAQLRDQGNRGKMKMAEDGLYPPKDDNGMYILGEAPHRSANVFSNMMSTIFLREHNRLCDMYWNQHGDDWTDDQYFQEARRWVIALLQKITITEYLGVVLGNPLPTYVGYNASLTPGIDTFFATVTFRYGHSEPSDNYNIVDENGEFLTSIPFWQLQDLPLLETFGVETLSRSVALQRQEEVDIYYSDTLRSYTNMDKIKLDVAGVDYQRGRDRGIPMYNDVRRAFGLAPAKGFEDITSNVILQERLEALYQSVDKVEALAGGLSEDHVPGANFGQLFMASMIKQWSDIRDSDRFWYENPGLFTEDELAELRNTTWRDVVVRNLEGPDVSLPDNVWFVQPISSLGQMSRDGDGGNATSLYTNSLKLADVYNIQWYVDGTNLRFLITFKSDNGWFGMGFGSTDGGMTGADFVIATVTKVNGTSVVSVGEYLSIGYQFPVYDSQIQLINVNRTDVSNGITTVEFSRPLIPTAPKRAKINDFMNPFIFAYNPSSSIPSYHGGNRGYTKINYLSGTVYATAQSLAQFTKLAHGYGMFVTWGLVFPASVFIVRYMKHYTNNYMVLHRNLQLFGGITVSSFGSAAIATVDPAQRTLHACIGLALVVVIIFQFSLGFMSIWAQEQLQSFNKGIPRFIKRSHGVLGFCLLITAWVNIYLGLDTYGSPTVLKYVYFGYIGIVVAIFLAAEIFFRFFAREITLRKLGVIENNDQWSLRDMISKDVYANLPVFSWDDVNEKVAVGALLVVAEDIVFDIREWIPVHPGGSKILEKVVGTDITRDFLPELKNASSTSADIEKTLRQLSIVPAEKTGTDTSGVTDTKFYLYQASIFRDYAHTLPTRMRSKKSRLPNLNLAMVYDEVNSRRFRGSNSVLHQHSVFAARKLSTMALARLESTVSSQTTTQGNTNQKSQRDYRRYVLVHKETVTPEDAAQPVRKLTFQVVHRTQETVRQFLPGEYIEMQVKTKGQIVVRLYTPISGSLSTSFDIYMKIYAHGLMSQHVDSHAEGFELKVRGPFESGQNLTLRSSSFTPILRFASSPDEQRGLVKQYSDRTLLNTARPEDGCWQKLFMIAGGTGLSPCIQLIKHHLHYCMMRDYSMHLLFANNLIVDVIDALALDHFVTESKGHLTVTYTFSKPPEGWKGLYGYINAQILKRWMNNIDGDGTTSATEAGSYVELSQRIIGQFGKSPSIASDGLGNRPATAVSEEEEAIIDTDDEEGSVPLLRLRRRQSEDLFSSKNPPQDLRLSISTKQSVSNAWLNENVKFVVCGPPPMLEALESAFEELGIPEKYTTILH